MGRFAQDFKNYEQYDDDDCYRKTVPDGMTDALAELLATVCGDEGDPKTVGVMQAVATELLVAAGKKATTNWESGLLKTEIKSAYHTLREGKFDRFMDATRKAVARLYKACPPASRSDLLRDINEVFIEANFGYFLSATDGAETLSWKGRSEASDGMTSLASGADAVKDISQEALEHLEQAKAHLLTPDKPRSRKDAVRDAMSAMEALLKKLASENDISDATKKLRSLNVWGFNEIVKDGLSIWKHLHNLYPDIRHGQATVSEIELEEAIYWIDRITTYIKYMAARKRALGQ